MEASVVQMNDKREQFWQLLEPEYRRGMMFCRKLAGNRETGDDLYQDALVNAYTHFDNLRSEAAFRSWLYRIIINTFTSTTRRPWWRKLVPLTAEMELTLTGNDPVAVHTARRWLRRAFEAVTAEQQAMVTLHELEGWTIEELAGLLGKSESAVKVGLFRARRKMKQVLLAYAKKTKVKPTTGSVMGDDEQCAAVK